MRGKGDGGNVKGLEFCRNQLVVFAIRRLSAWHFSVIKSPEKGLETHLQIDRQNLQQQGMTELPGSLQSLGYCGRDYEREDDSEITSAEEIIYTEQQDLVIAHNSHSSSGRNLSWPRRRPYQQEKWWPIFGLGQQMSPWWKGFLVQGTDQSTDSASGIWREFHGTPHRKC